MAKKTNTTIGKSEYYRITRKVGMRKNKRGEWVSDYRQFYGKSKTEAEQKYQAYISSNSLARDKSLGELIDWWMDNIYVHDESLRDTTKTLHINGYHRIFDNADVLSERINRTTGADLQAVFSASSAGATTQRHVKSFLSRFYSYMMAQSVCTGDATLALVLPKPKAKKQDQDIEIFTDDELRIFLDSTPADHRLRLLIVLGIYTGARIGELLALTYSDIENGEIRINKQLLEIEPLATEKDRKTRTEISAAKTATSVRTLPLEPADFISKEIEAHRKWHTAEMLRNGYRTDQVFTTSSGALYFKSTIRTAFKRLCIQVGVKPRGFHVFRHTFGTRLAAAGEPIATVSRLLGHDSINVTAKYYVGIDSDSKRNALKSLAL